MYRLIAAIAHHWYHLSSSVEYENEDVQNVSIKIERSNVYYKSRTKCAIPCGNQPSDHTIAIC